MEQSNNFALIVIGIVAIIVEMAIGAATGFDLFLVGIIFMLAGGIGLFLNSFSYALLSITFLSILYIFLFRKIVKNKIAIEATKTNIENVIGRRGVVIKTITPKKTGQVQIEYEVWRARADKEIAVGQEITVLSVSGVTLYVE